MGSVMRRTLGLVLLVCLAGPSFAQEQKSPFRTVEPNPVPFDKADTWTLNFGYYPVRIVTVDVPGRGKQPVWYLLTEIWNKSGSPQLAIPEFTLVSKDLDMPGSYPDEPLPAVVKQIIAIEDPKNLYNIQTATQVLKNKIPMTKIDSVPNSVRVLAVWTTVPAKAATLNKFSIYVGGLSNGLIESDGSDGSKTIRRKTLQLDFVKPTDTRNIRSDDIKADDNNGLGGEKWYYRSSTVKKPDVPKVEK
jgi:hypothetical protein